MCVCLTCCVAFFLLLSLGESFVPTIHGLDTSQGCVSSPPHPIILYFLLGINEFNVISVFIYSLTDMYKLVTYHDTLLLSSGCTHPLDCHTD